MTPQSSQDVLRDIHLPDAISWWPPAIGWWILLFLIILAIVFIPKIYRHLTFIPFNKVAISRFENIIISYNNDKNAKNLVIDTSKLLRQIAMTYYGREEVAHITGTKWIDVLNEMTEEIHFSDEIKQCLVSAPYQKDISIDSMQLINATKEWLSALPNKIQGHKV